MPNFRAIADFDPLAIIATPSGSEIEAVGGALFRNVEVKEHATKRRDKRRARYRVHLAARCVIVASTREITTLAVAQRALACNATVSRRVLDTSEDVRNTGGWERVSPCWNFDDAVRRAAVNKHITRRKLWRALLRYMDARNEK